MLRPLLLTCDGFFNNEKYDMNKRASIKVLNALFIVVLMTACTSIESVKPTLTGNDRDSHGCIGSAGYLWCEHEKQCERSWELAAEKGFLNTQEAFNAYCK